MASLTASPVIPTSALSLHPSLTDMSLLAQSQALDSPVEAHFQQDLASMQPLNFAGELNFFSGNGAFDAESMHNRSPSLASTQGHTAISSPEPKMEALEDGPFNSGQEPILLSVPTGFIVAPSNSEMGHSFLTVSWPTFLAFICETKNVEQLPPRHPMRLFSKIVQENGMDLPSTMSNLVPATPTANALHTIETNNNGGYNAYSWGPEPQRHSSAAPNLARTFSDQQSIPRHFQPQSPQMTMQQRPQLGRDYASQYSGSPTTPNSYRARLNPHDDHYIFSQKDGKLYRMGTKEGERTLHEPDYVLLSFAAGTTREARERDGQRAIPAWTSAWPSSNEWLKSQVCGPSCMYFRGFSGKRPVLIREHFRKCQHLSENHPLKILCRLELEAHARNAWGDRGIKRKRVDLSVSTTSNNDPAWVATALEPYSAAPYASPAPNNYQQRFQSQSNASEEQNYEQNPVANQENKNMLGLGTEDLNNLMGWNHQEQN